MTDFDDDVPPLEDMSDLLEQVQRIHGNQTTYCVSDGTSSSGHNTTVARSEPVKVSLKDEAIKKDNNTTSTKSASSNSFGGMKKGFLFGSAPKTKSTKKTTSAATTSKALNGSTDNDIPLIKPKMDSKAPNEIPEVQEALKTSAPFLKNTDWITDDLLKKLDQNPRLLQQLSDPRISQAMTKFQRNPQLAMQEYQDNKEIQQFFKDFCGVLGDHFEKLDANPQSPSAPSTQMPRNTHDLPRTQGIQTHKNSADISVRSSTNPRQATAGDEAKMQQILSDPEIRDILQDEEIQRMFAALRSNPNEAQRMLQKLGPEGQRKVQKLVNAGLLGFNSR